MVHSSPTFEILPCPRGSYHVHSVEIVFQREVCRCKIPDKGSSSLPNLVLEVLSLQGPEFLEY